jgi:CelD/BcsL family acetyltransferase involved in cellulose biosynthesis
MANLSLSPAPPSLRTLTGSEQFAQLDSAAWDRLVSAAARPSPYLLSTWVRSWLAEPSFEADPCIVVAERDGALVGAAPFILRRSGGARLASFVGAHESALGDILLAPDEGVATARSMLDGVIADGKPDAFDVFGLPSGSHLAEVTGQRMTMIQRVESPVTEMPDGWEAAYARHASARRRSNDRRRDRQLSEVGDVDYSFATDGETVLKDLPAAFELHRMRWEGRPDGSSFGTPGGQRFQLDVLPRLADEGHFSMLTVRIDGRPAAFQAWFAIGPCVYLYRNGYAEEVGRFGPGLIALRRAMAAASDAGATRMEYLGGNERYKQELSDRLDPLYQGYGLARGPVGHLYVAKARLSVAIRQRLKRSERLHQLYTSGALRVRRSSPSSPAGDEGEDKAAA